MPPSGAHRACFYEDAYPAEAAADFLAEGMRAGDACVVILLKEHLDALEQQLQARGISSGAAARGYYKTLDTADALAALMSDGRLHMKRAASLLESVLDEASLSGRRRVRLVGEPAQVLHAAGNERDGLALERLVDGLAVLHGASVLCAYPVRGFSRRGGLGSLLAVCAEHSALDFPPGIWCDSHVRTAPIFAQGGHFGPH